MRLFSKKTKEPFSLEDAIRIAKEKYPERYEMVDFDGKAQEQMVDVNKIARALYVRKLVHIARSPVSDTRWETDQCNG